MKVIPSALPDVLIIEPRVFEDERGFFYESFNEREFGDKTGITAKFVQDNHSKSKRNVLRGLHYQAHHPQGKLIRAIVGEIYDVAVDIRKSSPTFSKWVAHRLSNVNKRMLWIPSGFAHGFLVLSESAEIQYKTTDYWSPQFERCIMWNEPSLRIGWPSGLSPLLSQKDQEGLPLAKAELFP